MPSLHYLELNIDDFENSDWETVISNAPKNECSSYYKDFFQKALETEDKRHAEVLTLLGAITSMHLKPETDEIYHPLFTFTSMRGFSLDDLSEDHIAILSQFVSTVEDPELRARIADVIWVKGRSPYFSVLPIAIQAYIESGNLLLYPEDTLLGRSYTHRSVKRFERALDLSVSTNQKPLIEEALDAIERAIANSANEEELEFPYIGLIRLLWSYRQFLKSSKYIDICDSLAINAEQERNWVKAATYWILKADWANHFSDEKAHISGLIKSAEAHVEVAKIYAENSTSNYAAACFQLERAIEKLRVAGGMQKRCQELHSLLVHYQKLSVEGFQTHFFSVDSGDIANIQQKAAQYVSNQTWEDAICLLANITRPTKVNDLRQQVETDIFGEKFSLRDLFSTQVVDYKGRPIAQSPALFNATEEDQEIALRSRMYQKAIYRYQYKVITRIQPAIKQIFRDHYVKIKSWEFLVKYNKFVPENHVYLFMKGLHAGFQGDFITSIHVLIPQIENSLRHILQQRNIQAYSLDTDTGLQQAHTLETLLEKTPELVEILVEGIIFDLKALLIRKFGNNYRNDMAHGLMSTERFYNSNMLYLWWLTLFLLYHGLPNAYKNNSTEK